MCRKESSITDIALDSGYETPSAFHKAFVQHFGESPSDFRKKNRAEIFPAQQLFIQHKEKMVMEPKIVEREPKRALCVRATGPYSQSAQEAWGGLCAFAMPRGLFEQPGAEAIGVSYDDPETADPDTLRYDACITVADDVEAEGNAQIQTIEGGKYAVFLHEGPYENLTHTYQGIYGQWVPENSAKLRDLPCFEIYLNAPGEVPPEELKTEIYIPIE
ncbi:MAG: AraC family transcriptional regulator [Verrucomicrobia bacterium]|nr:AraC family transcriptional regulator [Verrucomicrobiota bacterium]